MNDRVQVCFPDRHFRKSETGHAEQTSVDFEEQIDVCV